MKTNDWLKSKAILSCILLFFGIVEAFAQSYSNFVTVSPLQTNIARYKTSNPPPTYSYISTITEIGRKNGANNNSNSNEDIYRSAFTFNLLTAGIPSDAIVNSAKLIITISGYQDGQGGNKGKVVSLAQSVDVNNASVIFDAIGSGSPYVQDLLYNDTYNKETSITSAVAAALITSLGTIKIGALSMNEGDNNTNADLTISLEVTYTPKVTITLQNSYNSGNIKVDGSTIIAHNNTTKFIKGSTHTLLAYDQESGGVTYTPDGNWLKDGTETLNSNPLSITPTSNATYRANYVAAAKTTVKNSFNGGLVKVGNSEPRTPYASGSVFPFPVGSGQTLEAFNQDYQAPGELNNYFRVFQSQWKQGTTDYSTSNPVGITADIARTYEATFKKQFNVSATTATYIESGSGGTYKVNGANVGETWQGTFIQDTQSPITLEAVPPSGWAFTTWSDGVTTNSLSIIPTDHLSIYAAYKYINHTQTSTALANTSQRKVVRTDEGYLFLAYESMNRVWLERSVDEGATWTLCNNGPIDNGPEAKSPSIDYLTEVYYGGVNNELFITYQQKTSSGNYTIQIARCNNAGQKLSDQLIYTSPSSYNNNATPVISITWFMRNYPEWRKQIVGIWKEPASSGVNAGLYWYGAYYTGSTFNWNSVVHSEQIANTTTGSVNPSIDIFKYDSDARTSALNFHFAWEQAGQSINYWQVICGYSGLSLSGFVSTPSYGDGWPNNYRPSITAVTNTGARLSWQGYYNDGADIFSSTIFADPGYPNHFWNFGSDVTSTNISKNYDILYGTSSYAIGWTQFNGSAYSNYAVKNTTLSGPINLNTAGKDMQLYNSWNFTDQRGVSLTTSSPYAFQLSTTIEQSGGGGGKELDKNSSIQISAGRMGVVTSGNAQFHFTLGDISVNGAPIDFKELTDTSKIISSDEYKSFLITKQFVLDEKSQFFYGVQYGVTDSAAAVSVLGDNKKVHFTVELIDAATEQIIGVTDDVTYSAANVTPYENIAYEVNTNGIGNKTVKLRLSVSTTLSANYTLADKRAQSSILAKQGSQRVQKDYNGSLVVKEYALLQNYPNPFNPTTTISYALPKSGNVVLKVYDALGREVTTLVNTHQESGRYSVNFDASKLSSGMYIYKLTSEKFSQVKKMLLLR